MFDPDHTRELLIDEHEARIEDYDLLLARRDRRRERSDCGGVSGRPCDAPASPPQGGASAQATDNKAPAPLTTAGGATHQETRS